MVPVLSNVLTNEWSGKVAKIHRPASSTILLNHEVKFYEISLVFKVHTDCRYDFRPKNLSFVHVIFLSWEVFWVHLITKDK